MKTWILALLATLVILGASIGAGWTWDEDAGSTIVACGSTIIACS